MLLSNGNPYKILNNIKLTKEDFTFTIGSQNLVAMNKKATWCIVVYMAADCDLAEYMYENLLALKKIGSNLNVHLCVFFDGPYITDTFLARLNQNTGIEEDFIVKFSHVNSSDPNTLKEILTNCAVMFPSDKKLLVLSSHGIGWRGALNKQYTWKEYLHKGKISFPEGDPVTWLKQLDEAYKLAIETVKSQFKDNELYKGKNFDIIALDACYMGNLEALSMWNNSAEIIVASENFMPGNGYPYSLFIQKIINTPDININDAASLLVSLTKSYHQTILNASQITQAAISCKMFEQLLQQLQELILLLINQMKPGNDVFQKISSTIESIDTFNKGCIDLILLLNALIGSDLSAPITFTAQKVLEFINTSEFFISREVPSNPYLMKGLSIYLPKPEEFEFSYIENLKFLHPFFSYWVTFIALYYVGILGVDSHKNQLVAYVLGRLSETQHS